jgi:hypothetical protein
MQFVLGAVMKKLNIGIHFASRDDSRDDSKDSIDQMSAVKENVSNVESILNKKRGRRQTNPLFGYQF